MMPRHLHQPCAIVSTATPAGIVIAAKTAEALRILNDKIKDREMEKRYLCIVHGRPKPPEGLIENYLRRDEKRKQVTLHRTRVPGARPHAHATARSRRTADCRSWSVNC